MIFVPKADLTLVQAVPTEIRELDLYQFHFWLLDYMDNEDGMPHPDTHIHNTEVDVGGLTLARVIQLINGYTVTFEDGQYAVNLVGANSNVGDNVNVNQVSVRSYNSAGLISSPAIEYASFNGGVTVDVTSSYSGTLYPVGTPRQPVNNMTDALLIAAYRGFTTFFILGNIDLDSQLNYSDYVFIGESMNRTTINIVNDSDVANCEFYEARVTGTLDGDNLLKHCKISDLNYVYGIIEQCLLEPGTIVLAGNNPAVFLDCWSGNEDTDSGGLQYPTIDLGGAGQPLTVRNYNGYLKLTNKSGDDHACVDLNSGLLSLDSTVTNGLIDVRGIGHVIDATTGNAVVNDQYLVSNDRILDTIQAMQIEGGITLQQAQRLMLAVLAGKSSGGDTSRIKFRDTGDSKDRVDETVDEDGNRLTVALDLD